MPRLNYIACTLRMIAPEGSQTDCFQPWKLLRIHVRNLPGRVVRFPIPSRFYQTLNNRNWPMLKLKSLYLTQCAPSSNLTTNCRWSPRLQHSNTPRDPACALTEMCFIDVVRYVCGGEEYILIERCIFPTLCIPHVRQMLHSTLVCELCGRAWTVSALTDEAYEAVTTPLIESGQGYFDCFSRHAASSAPLKLPGSPTLEPVQEPTADQVAEGLYAHEITLPLRQNWQTLTPSPLNHRGRERHESCSEQKSSPAKVWQRESSSLLAARPRRHSY